MKKIGVTYEISRRVYKEYKVTNETYKRLYSGDPLPEDILVDLEDEIDSLNGDRDDDYAIEDLETGKTIQDWRN